MVAALGAALVEHHPREAARRLVVGDLGQVAGPHRVAPLVGQLLERQAQHPLERALDPAGHRALEDRADGLVAPLLAHVGEQRVAEPVGKHARIVRHPLDGRERPLDGGVADPHGRGCVHRPERQVLGHAFHEPQRRVHVGQRGEARPRVAAAEHVVLEGVHHLVLQHVFEVGIRAGERQHHAVLEELGDAARALADLAGDGVGLDEVGLRGVQDERFAIAPLVIQDARQPGVGPLGHARGVHRGGALPAVEVHVEVLGADDLEREPAVHDLVLAEILGLEPPPRGHGERERDKQRPEPGSHGQSPWAISRRGASPHSPSSW